MKLKSGAWIVVADGSHGIVFENEGTAVAPKLKALRHYDQDNPRSSAQGEARPPRGFSPSGGRRAAFEGTDLHQVQEDRFIAQILGDLEQDAKDGVFKEIVVVLPPAALGTFRKSASRGLTQRVVLWLDKDLTKHPVTEIAAAVTRALEGDAAG